MKKLHQNDSLKAFECFQCMTVSTSRYTLARFKEQSGKRYIQKVCESCATDTQQHQNEQAEWKSKITTKL